MTIAISRLALVFVWIVCSRFFVSSTDATAEEYLAQGDQLLSSGSIHESISVYQQGLELIEQVYQQQDDNDDYLPPSLLTEISLHTNLATAWSSTGNDEQAAASYQDALVAYQTNIEHIVDKSLKAEIDLITAQTAFFLGMVYQDLPNASAKDAVDAYRYAFQLDPLHWAAVANLASVLHDDLANHDAALEAYNQAYNILTGDQEPTDPPAEPQYILSQLQYRIGLCLNHDVNRKCVIPDETTGESTIVDCSQQAAYAFHLAVEYDPDNESAKHMLATLTADASVERASNTYVKSLFDDYAKNFEHSLVQELGYTGYERLRRGFDRAFVKLAAAGGSMGSPESPTPVFDLVVDAGCGTGLVGEQFRNVSKTLIGVDLSEAILKQALEKRPNLYDETIADDVMKVFRDKKPISLIIAGDSYIYFGDLDPLFEAMKDGLEHGGFAAFTLENVDKESEETLATTKPDWRWQLTPSGRFAHRKTYVEQVGIDHDLHLVHHEPLVDFRFERGVGVQGHVFVLRKGIKSKLNPTSDEL